MRNEVLLVLQGWLSITGHVMDWSSSPYTCTSPCNVFSVLVNSSASPPPSLVVSHPVLHLHFLYCIYLGFVSGFHNPLGEHLQFSPTASFFPLPATTQIQVSQLSEVPLPNTHVLLSSSLGHKPLPGPAQALSHLVSCLPWPAFCPLFGWCSLNIPSWR